MDMLLLEKKTALEAVVKACAIAKKIQTSLEKEDVFCKDDYSPVTLADYCCQVIINKVIKKAFPQDEIMGEEGTFFLQSADHSLIKKIANELHIFEHKMQPHDIFELLAAGHSQGGKNRRFWAVDPIDGTKGFLRQDQYAVAIALIENGKVVLGVLGCPKLHFKEELGSILIAEKNHGCLGYTMDLQQKMALKVATFTNPNDVIYCEPHSTSQTHSHSLASLIAQDLKVNNTPFQLDSQCKYALVAQGKASVYLRLPSKNKLVFENQHEKLWDHAAGSIIVEEAGGKVSDAYGKDLDFSQGVILKANRGIIATNGKLHSQVVNSCLKFIA